MATAEICNVEPFRYQSTPQMGDQGGVSGNQINEQYLEDYLSRMRIALCSDIQSIVDLIDSGALGATNFLQLSDTPDTYAGSENFAVAVNSAGTGLEFIPFPDIPPPPTYFLTPRLIALWPPQGSTGQIGPAPTTVGAGTIQIVVNPATPIAATYRTQMTSGTGANAQAGIRTVVFQAIRGTAAPMGGFRLRYRFACEIFTAGHRGFVGMNPQAAAFPAAASEPSALTNFIALAFDSTDTNWQIMNNDNAGTATKTDLGAGFAVNNTSILELTIELEPSGSSFDWLVRDLSLGTEVSGTISSNLPVGGQPLGVALASNAAATGVAARLTHIFMSLEVGPGE